MTPPDDPGRLSRVPRVVRDPDDGPWRKPRSRLAAVAVLLMIVALVLRHVL